MIVIIGTGLAGYSLLRELRKKGCERPIMLITSDDGAAYSKPMLSTAVAKAKLPDELVQADAIRMAEQFQAEIRTFTRVDRIDPQNRTLWIGDEAVVYEDLVLATGAEVRRVPIDGNAADRVLSVNDLMDYRRLRDGLPAGSRVAILGAGLIGCEFANDFVSGDYPVTVIAPSETVLPLLVPDSVAVAVKTGLSAQGVAFRLGRFARSVDQGENGALVLTLDDGETLEADVVISAIGLKPATGLALEAGLDVNLGIQTDEFCRTSAEHIYALGDCAEVNGQNLLYVLPLMNCARALAATLSGTETAIRYPLMPIQIKTPACPVVVVPPVSEGSWQVTADSELDITAECRDDSGKLVGFALAGAGVSNKQKLGKEMSDAMSA